MSSEPENGKNLRDEQPLSAGELSPLISRAQAGDGQAFRALIEPHLQQVYRAAVQITKNHEDAEDACQNSLLKAFIHLRTFQGNSQFSTWLTRIAINEALMTIRKNRSETRYRIDGIDLFETPVPLNIVDRTMPSDPETAFIQSEQNARLREAINHLELKSRLIICQLGLEENRTKDVARQSHLSRSGVRSRLQRAIRKLRTMLGTKIRNGKEEIQELA